jgi:hypothetical protein
MSLANWVVGAIFPCLPFHTVVSVKKTPSGVFFWVFRTGIGLESGNENALSGEGAD